MNWRRRDGLVGGQSRWERMRCSVLLIGVGLCLLVHGEGVDKELNVCQRREVGDHLCPELFVLGVQKGGSSSIWVWLTENFKDLKVAESLQDWRKKEPHFFDLKHSYGLNYYSSLYPVRNSTEDWAVDGTPCYSRYAGVPMSMKKELATPRLRFIISFRDPVSRAMSWYRHVMTDFVPNPPGPMNPFKEAYEVFNNSFLLMAEYSPKTISRCVKYFKQEQDVFRQCWFNTGWHKLHRQVVPATGMTTKNYGAVAQIFIDGLYGYIMLHWLKQFPAEQFCIVIYEQIRDDFAAEMQYVEPCVQAFGRELVVPPGASLPQTNHKVCTDCEELDGNAKRNVGAMLHTEFYARSNEIFREIMEKKFNRPEILHWESLYGV